ncbi:hypothetical protein A4X13_0g7746 [Tilletia indica]|uniref:Uncharacterized protein n=1 Tax=Tilletia indica TaxID=43049 RepID=A0A177TCN0_9BASI|nr:hypothetical protein A4X13_0g7746 [Tilletia indica]
MPISFTSAPVPHSDNRALHSVRGGVLPTSDLFALTDILPGTGFPAVTDIIPTGVLCVRSPASIFPARALVSLVRPPSSPTLPSLVGQIFFLLGVSLFSPTLRSISAYPAALTSGRVSLPTDPRSSSSSLTLRTVLLIRPSSGLPGVTDVLPRATPPGAPTTESSVRTVSTLSPKPVNLLHLHGVSPSILRPSDFPHSPGVGALSRYSARNNPSRLITHPAL